MTEQLAGRASVPATAEERQAIEAAFLAAIIQSCDDAIASKDLNGIVTSWNKAAERIFGYTAEEMIGQPIAILVPPDRPDEEAGILARLRRGERIDHYETVRRHKDGTFLNVSVTISPVRDSQGRVIGASKVARDVTEQKRLQAELQRYAEDLALQDKRKDEFLAMLAHELRNPLAPILTAVEVLRMRSGRDPVVQKQCEIAIRQAKQMKRLLDDLLDVSRITRGKIKLVKERVDLATVLTQAVETSRPLIEERSHTLHISLPEASIEVRADPVRLSQVFTNLLNNAARYTEPGGRIWLTATREGDTARISVQDTGIGMTPETLAAAFELFVQGDRSIDRSYGGLGIGLTLTRELVQMHGGTITAHSSGLQQGSELVVTLPVVRTASGAAAEPPRAAVAPTPRRRATAPNGCSVLVVDDNPDQADGVASFLQMEGYEVCLAHDGAAALDQARIHRPLVGILDIGLPGLDGYELARQLRAEPGLPPMTLVAVTGYGGEEDRAAATSAGFDYHLVKPFEVRDLLALMPGATQQKQL